MKIFSLTFFFTLLFSLAYSQEKVADIATGKNDTIKVYATRDFDGSWIPWIPLGDLPITAQRVFKSPEARFQYDRLRYTVIKVLPYARFARNRYSKLSVDLAKTDNKREQRKLIKACDKEIKDMFNKQIKNMSPYQGTVLIKLIDRETGRSTYDHVKELKGGLTAFVYQSLARINGNDLKDKYDIQEDRDIENILQSLGSSYYSSSN